MLNAQIIGNVGKDPETRQVGDNRVVSFSVASTKKVKGESLTTWVKASAWNATGEIIEKYVKKGDKIFLQGELEIKSYTNKEGVEVQYLEMRVDKVQLIGNSVQGGEYEKSQTETKPVPKVEDNDMPLPEDNLPF